MTEYILFFMLSCVFYVVLWHLLFCDINKITFYELNFRQCQKEACQKFRRRFKSLINEPEPEVTALRKNSLRRHEDVTVRGIRQIKNEALLFCIVLENVCWEGNCSFVWDTETANRILRDISAFLAVSSESFSFTQVETLPL